MDEVCSVCCFGDGDLFTYDPNPNSFNDSQHFSDYPPQPQYQTYSYELYGNDAHYGYDCPPQVPFLAEERFLKIKQAVEEEQNQPENIQELLLKLINDLQILNGIQLKQEEQAAKVSSQYWKPSIFYDDDDEDDEESSIPLRDIISEPSLSESDEENESSVKDLNLTPSESEDLSDNESECDMPVCDDSSSKNEVRLIEKLLNDDSFPHSLEELNYEIPDAIIESFSPSPIPVEDIDSLMEEIDIFLAPDDSIPLGIKNDDYDLEGDVLFLAELLNNDYISLPEYESYHVDFYNVPSSPRPPEKPPDDDVYFDIEPDTRVLTTKVVDDISDNSTRELYVHVPNVLTTLPILYPVFDTLLPFSSENEDIVFNPGILISNEEKSPHLLSHRGFKVF
ncbi:hypothetical protein Tco_0237766 [Tanacetum coccineum]